MEVFCSLWCFLHIYIDGLNNYLQKQRRLYDNIENAVFIISLQVFVKYKFFAFEYHLPYLTLAIYGHTIK